MLKGLRIVHVEGFRVPKDSPINIVGTILEGCFGVSSTNILNVSKINSSLVELIVDSSCIPALQSALSVADCPLKLHMNLDARSPLSNTTDTAAAEASFIKRVSREIERLKPLKSPSFRRMAELLVEYRENQVRFYTPPSRPSQIFMSSFFDAQMMVIAPVEPSTSLAPAPTDSMSL